MRHTRGNKKHVNSKRKSIKMLIPELSAFFIRGNWQAWREYKQQRCRHLILTRIVFPFLRFTVKMPMNLWCMTSIFIKQVYRFFRSFFSFFLSLFIHLFQQFSFLLISVFSILLKTTSSWISKCTLFCSSRFSMFFYLSRA
jgi:hypothetical protein